MNDKELCAMFGTTLEEVESDAEVYESGDISAFKFGEPIEGRPTAKLKPTSMMLFDFEIEAIDRAAKKEGISRSAFIRRALDNELISLS